jgi:hypothetical protein
VREDDTVPLAKQMSEQVERVDEFVRTGPQR